MRVRPLRLAWRLLLSVFIIIGLAFVLFGIFNGAVGLRIAGQGLLLCGVLLVLSYCNQYRERIRYLEAQIASADSSPGTSDAAA